LFPLIYFIEHSPTTSDLVCAIQDLDRPTDIQWLGYGPLGPICVTHASSLYPHETQEAAAFFFHEHFAKVRTAGEMS